MELARAQSAYCSVIVHWGTHALNRLAGTLASDDWWFFWWD
jgi:hypothetical protein